METAAEFGKTCLSDEALGAFHSGGLDQQLRQQVENHLGSCRRCEARLRQLSSGHLRSTETVDTTHPVTPAVEQSRQSTRSFHADDSHLGTPATVYGGGEPLPVKIGDYFIVRLLGQGGFGSVYLARDPLHQRMVALKVPRPDRVMTRRHRDAFLKEARTLAELEHPNIVPLYDCHELDDGRCIVVMQYVEGRTLRDLLQNEPPTPAQAAQLVASIADALAYAHQRKVWHRDIKPANILIARDGTAYLTDFGLAVNENVHQLKAGELAGTYPYMSPEQIQARSEILDGRSDIWNLGVIFYELLTGRRPFTGRDYPELLEQITKGSPPALSELDPPIDRRYQDACLKCLRPDPDERFATAEELAEQLRGPIHFSALSRWSTVGAALLMIALVGAVVLPASRHWWKPPGKPGEAARNAPAPQGETAVLAGQGEAPAEVPMTVRPLAWPTLQTSDFHKAFPESNRLAVKSSAWISCLETHRPATDRYRFRCSAEFQDEIGIAGLAIGIHETGAEPTEYKCVTATIRRGIGEDGTWLILQDCVIGLNELRHMDVRDRVRIGIVQLDIIPHKTVDLEIEVEEGRVVDIRYGRRSVPEAVEVLKDSNIAKNSTCGVVAMSHVVFHDLYCEELKE